jgi:hypothetical protein
MSALDDFFSDKKGCIICGALADLVSIGSGDDFNFSPKMCKTCKAQRDARLEQDRAEQQRKTDQLNWIGENDG